MYLSRGRSKVLILFIFLVFSLTPSVGAQPKYTPKELVFTVYSDGVVVIDYLSEVDPTQAKVSITLFGFIYEDILVEDQDGLLLGYTVAEGEITVDSLGSTAVIITYLTPDLTDKSAQIWTFSSSTPISSSIILPKDSTIIGLNVVPISLGNLNGNPLLIMPSGDVEVTYTIGVVGTREHAIALIKDAESTIETLKTKGIFVGEAESLLQQAYDSFDLEQYVEAEQLANQSKTSALNSEAAASSSEEALNVAVASISAAESKGRTVGLEIAEELYAQALSAYGAGDYEGALDLAKQAQTAAIEATKPKNLLNWLLIGGLAVFIALAFGFFVLRGRIITEEIPEQPVDLESLFERHPNLRVDDREVLRFLTESGGEAFATEIRDRFEIPRTSAWRMIRRLQREGIIEVKNIGGQSLARIRQEYRRKQE